MIDLARLRENTDEIKSLIAKKEPNFNIDELIDLDKKFRDLKIRVENLRKERNEVSSAAKGGITDELRARSIEIGKKLKQSEVELSEVEPKFRYAWLSCPNIIQEDIPLGGKENNEVIKVFGEKPEFLFTPRHHMEISDGWIDFEAGAKMAGSHFAVYKNDAVKLMYALSQLMLKVNAKAGFTPISVPEIVNEKSLTNSGNLPKFAEDVYKTEDDLYLIPTAEVNLTNLYANEILDKDSLPLRHCAWTRCFRREAGGYGAQERGLIRIHQFEKVELYTICQPSDAKEEQERMLACAEEILQKLNLHYRVSLLASEDCSFSSSKTYDVEVWLPGQQKYYEVSSISNCTDFQARRASIRYREDGKPHLAYTLNASSLALPRLMVAIMETFQDSEGEIKLPTVLQEIMDNLW